MTVHSNFLNRSIIEHSCYVCSWLPAGNLLLFVLIIKDWWQVTAACCLQRTKEKRFLTVKWLGKLSFRTTAKTAKWLTESIQIHKKVYHSRDHLEVNLALKPISPLEFPRALTPNPCKISNSFCGIDYNYNSGLNIFWNYTMCEWLFINWVIAEW